jgi:NADPH:quinone reductase-like Zn-dependent oxidoreductase
MREIPSEKTMKALRFSQHGAPDVLALLEIDTPHAEDPPGREAVVAVKAASINPSDVKNVQGRMSQTTLPRTPGRDYSGVVVEGPAQWLGVEVWGSGDAGFTRDGTHAERIQVPVTSLRRKPSTLTHVQAASIGVNFIAAWCGIVEAAKVQADDTVVIIGLGGVGGAAAQIARRIGARVIGVTRGAKGHTAVNEIISADGPTSTLVEEVRRQTGGGATVVYDTVGGSMFEVAVQMLARRGRLVEISATDRKTVSFDLADFYHNESQLLGVDTLKRDLVASALLLEALRPGFEDGSYQPPEIGACYSLADGAKAYAEVLAGSKGRIVLTP